MSKTAIAGCFFLDSSVLLSEVLRQNEPRMSKLRADVKRYSIGCNAAQRVIAECQEKIEKTTNFVGDILQKTIVTYLEGPLYRRDLNKSKPSNNDLRIIREAFLEINKLTRAFDLFSDPFQAIEEWIVAELEKELSKPAGISLGNFLDLLTAKILERITRLENDFERIVDFEAEYIKKSVQTPDPAMSALLLTNGFHDPDCDHISVAFAHERSSKQKTVFLTFDYKTILHRWYKVKCLSGITCCDPLYGLSCLR